MNQRLQFLLQRLGERLWVKPLAMCVFSVLVALVASHADRLAIAEFLPDISADTIETLLQILSASMLVIATFAVGSMVSSYASAGGNATPRAFSLVVADDVSQNALSSFIGAFIFSVVAIVALDNGFYGHAGRFTLFLVTLLVFCAVVLTFVRWVDSIARLGRLGTAVDKVEAATAAAMKLRRRSPTLGARPAGAPAEHGTPLYGTSIGYVQHIDTAAMQECAEQSGTTIAVAVLPGGFVSPDRPLAFVSGVPSGETFDETAILDTITVGRTRTFSDDPRFGLVVLAQIAGRALSPGVNDPGTAIDIIGSMVRLFCLWVELPRENEPEAQAYDRLTVCELAVGDMFDDAFTAIGRDGAGAVEVATRLQKALRTLQAVGDADMKRAAARHAAMALTRARTALTLPEDLDQVESASIRATAR